MKWFKRTPKTYKVGQMYADHGETYRAVFGEDYQPVSVAEQIHEAEQAAVENVDPVVASE